MLVEMTYTEVYSSNHVYEDTCLTCSQKLYIENRFKGHVMG
jgi:hypothetical protein